MKRTEWMMEKLLLKWEYICLASAIGLFYLYVCVLVVAMVVCEWICGGSIAVYIQIYVRGMGFQWYWLYANIRRWRETWMKWFAWNAKMCWFDRLNRARLLRSGRCLPSRLLMLRFAMLYALKNIGQGMPCWLMAAQNNDRQDPTHTSWVASHKNRQVGNFFRMNNYCTNEWMKHARWIFE